MVNVSVEVLGSSNGEVETKDLTRPVRGQPGVIGTSIGTCVEIRLFVGMVGRWEETGNSKGTRGAAVGGICVSVLAEIGSSVCCRRRSTQMGIVVSFEKEIMGEGSETTKGVDRKGKQLNTLCVK